MGTELVAETSENLHILTRLSARENFIGLTDGINYRVGLTDDVHYRVSVNMKYGYSRTNLSALHIETFIPGC